LMALAATALDVLLGGFAKNRPVRILCPLAAAIVIACTIIPLWRGLHVRQTNMDLVAAKLEASAAADDLIIVNPWYLGVGFHYHFHGRTRWVSVPPIEDLRIHRYDLLKSAYQSVQPMEPVLAAIGQTLRSGHRLWLVGGLPEG